ncbi:MAG: hypothetical protein KDD56_00180 [Bdellovibrionales bacterium]|nr:hypothetical protein [Bdellovibrionales bacterium]
MKISIFAPQASYSPEAGTLFLFSRYLRDIGYLPKLVTNNGIFSILETDVDKTWKQSVVPCLACLGEQKRLAEWADSEIDELSKYLFPTEVRETKRWIEKQKAERLLQLEVKGLNLFELAKESFTSRFGMIIPDMNNISHETMVRRLLLSVSRMLIASRRYFNHNSPKLTFIAGGQDFISRSFAVEAVKHQVNPAVFSWEPSARAVRITNCKTNESVLCEFIVEDVAMLRPEPKTWPEEVHAEMQTLANFFDISQYQLELPMAR